VGFFLQRQRHYALRAKLDPLGNECHHFGLFGPGMPVAPERFGGLLPAFSGELLP
jgi:hypothetical protein